jgi:hypothetical protein
MVDTKETAKNGGTGAGKTGPSKPAPTDETEQIVLTVGAAKGEVLKVERIDRAGHRHELSHEEFSELAGSEDADDLEHALGEAYGAGILDAFGDEEGDEDEEESTIRRLLLARLLARRTVRRRVRRLILARALRRRLLERQKSR